MTQKFKGFGLVMTCTYRSESKWIITKEGATIGKASTLQEAKAKINQFAKLERLKYEGKPLIAIYEVKDSANVWHEERAIIGSQEEFNDLINSCNRYINTMNLVHIMEYEMKPIKMIPRGNKEEK